MPLLTDLSAIRNARDKNTPHFSPQSLAQHRESLARDSSEMFGCVALIN